MFANKSQCALRPQPLWYVRRVSHVRRLHAVVHIMPRLAMSAQLRALRAQHRREDREYYNIQITISAKQVKYTKAQVKKHDTKVGIVISSLCLVALATMTGLHYNACTCVLIHTCTNYIVLCCGDSIRHPKRFVFHWICMFSGVGL